MCNGPVAMHNTEIVHLVVDAALVVAWIAVVVLPLLPLARKTAGIEKLTVKPDTVASADRNLTKLTYKMKSLELENYSAALQTPSHALRKLGG